MSNAVINDPGLPLLSTITNLWRAKVNDPNADVIQDGEPTITVPILMSAIRDVYRELRNIGDPTLITDNYVITGLPPVTSPSLGVSSSDPAVQVQLSTVGFFDGVKQWSTFLLPSDCLRVVAVWTRRAKTNDIFTPLPEAVNGINPVGQQFNSLGEWEWRQNSLNFTGCLQSMDVRIRYEPLFQEFFASSTNYANTTVGIPDSADAIAAKCVYKYNAAQGSMAPAILEEAKDEAEKAMFELKLTQVRAMQGAQYTRKPYGRNYDNGHLGQ